MTNIVIDYIKKVTNGENLSEEESSRAFQIVMSGGATQAQISALLVGLKMKGETVDEMVGAAKVMRAKASAFKAPEGCIDTCGTGGDGLSTLNISTAVAFVVAACGVRVAKHGNKAASSKSGSADVLEALGVNINADTSVMEEALRHRNLCYLQATKYHTAMRHVAPLRQELQIRTLFNIIGPLSNPAKPDFQLLGVYDESLMEPMANVLNGLGVKRAWVVHGDDGMDELTITGSSSVVQLDNGELSSFKVNPEEFGLTICNIDDISGGDVGYNASELKMLLLNQRNEPYLNIVLLNAAACLVIAQKCDDLAQGVDMAREALASGAAMNMLEQLVEYSNQPAVVSP